MDFGFGGLIRDPESEPAAARLGVRHDAVVQPPPVRRARLRPDGRRPGCACIARAFEFFGGVPRRDRARQSPGRDRPRRALRSRGAAQLPGVRRALRLSHRALSAADARAQGQGRAGRRPLRQAQRPGRPRLPRLSTTANRHLLRWCVETAGRRVHGTTKQIPLEVFDQVERAALQPLPLTPWELAEWKQAKLHPDCHVVFAGAYYSAPASPHRPAALGPRHRRRRSSCIRSTPSWRRIGAPAPASGAPSPPTCRRTRSTSSCRRRPGAATRAAEIGPACADFIERLLGDRPLDRLRERPGRPAPRASATAPPRLEAACARAARRAASIATTR